MRIEGEVGDGGDDSSHPLHDHEVGKEVTGLTDDFSLMLLKKVRTAF